MEGIKKRKKNDFVLFWFWKIFLLKKIIVGSVVEKMEEKKERNK